MPQFELLGSTMRGLHQEFVNLYYLFLPVFFALAVIVAWVRSPCGSLEFVDIIKRTVVATVLLVAFPDITNAILLVADGITERIDKLNTLDHVIRMAQEKTESYSFSVSSMLIQFNDLIIATLSFLSYLILYVARYLTVAMYHFFWTFFMISAPLLLLFNLFEGTQQITKNLFKGMIEVACWKIVWAILGAMLLALSFGDAYKTEGNYLTLIVMNFVIACAMLMTPMLVKSIIGSGLQSMSSALGAAAVTAIGAAPAKALTAVNTSRSAINRAGNFVHSKVDNYRQDQAMKKNPYLQYTNPRK